MAIFERTEVKHSKSKYIQQTYEVQKNQMDLNCKVLEDNQRYKIVSFE